MFFVVALLVERRRDVDYGHRRTQTPPGTHLEPTRNFKVEKARPMKGSSPDPDSTSSVMQLSPAFKSAGVAVLGLLLLAPATFAADGESTPLNLSDTKAKAAETAGTASGGLVRTIVGLAIVIGVIYGLYWVLKQVKASREDSARAPAWRRSPRCRSARTGRCTCPRRRRGRPRGRR